MTDNAAQPPESPQSRLARKLNLLLDLRIPRERAALFQEISSHMDKRERRSHVRGGPTCRSGDSSLAMDQQLLQNLAEFFGVDRRYLLDDSSEVPQLVEAQLDLLRSMREARVKNFAARQLQELSPDSSQAERSHRQARQGR